MAPLKYWLWLTSRKGMDSVAALTVLDRFVTPELAYYADPEEYEHLPLRPIQRQSLLDKSMDLPERILEQCEMQGLRVMTYQDADYPQRLKNLADPPAVLYIRGKVFHFDEEAAIGVVGAREPSPYGIKYAERFGMELAAGGALVVSGIAEGLDSCAIRGALKGGGPVVSVLAGGVDMVFPPRNRYLYEDVAAAGALISENPPGTPHKGMYFLRRNRILSGLCLGVLAVECRPYGGTMNTVGHALEQDRDVFAIPGSLDAPMSAGTNRLIQQGAKLVTCGRDILEEYWDRFPVKLAASAPLTPDAAKARLDDLRSRDAAPESPKPEAKGEKPAKKPEADSPVQDSAISEDAPAWTGRTLVPRDQQRERFTDDELAILAALGDKTRSADELVELTQIPAKRVLSALTMLQVQGAVEERPGRRFYALVELEN